MLLRSTTSTNIFSDAVFFSVLALGYIRTPLSMTVSMLTILTSSGLSSYLTDFLLFQCVPYFTHAVLLVFLLLQCFSGLEYDIGLLTLLLNILPICM
jgi:hypothetical protein